MRQRSYPLEVVRTQRDLARKQAELELMSARGKLFDAEKALAAAQAGCKAQAAKRAQLVTPDPERSVTSSQVLSWSGAYAARLELEARKLARSAQAAQTEVTDRARALRLAELAWQRAYAESETLERHHERFREAERKAAEKADELESEDYAHQAQLRMRT